MNSYNEAINSFGEIFKNSGIDLNSASSAIGGLVVGILILLLIAVIVALVAFIIFTVGRYKFYQKCGQPGWKALIPFYSKWTLVSDIAGLNWYWFLAAIASFIISIALKEPGETLVFVFNIAVLFADIAIAYNLAKKLNKGTAWIVLASIFPELMYTIAGFSSSTNYDASIPVSKDAFIRNNTSTVEPKTEVKSTPVEEVKEEEKEEN